MDANGRKLSKLQTWILFYLWERTSWVEKTGNDFANRMLEIGAVRWHPGRFHAKWTAADRANVSRALQRLEARGLVIRNNDRTGIGPARTSREQPAPSRATCVKLTPAGRTIAKRLTLADFTNVSRFSEAP